MKNWLRVFFTNLNNKRFDLDILRKEIHVLKSQKQNLEADVIVLRTEYDYIKGLQLELAKKKAEYHLALYKLIESETLLKNTLGEAILSLCNYKSTRPPQ